MKHNPSLLLFLFIHRLEEIPQFHLLLFSVILSKMKINPLFYVRCVLMRVCVSWSFWSRRVWDYVIQWITSLDYVTFLSIILNIKFSLLSVCFHISILHIVKNAMPLALFILASAFPSSCLKGFEVLILAGSSLKLSKKAKFSEATAQQLARTGPNGFHGT